MTSETVRVPVGGEFSVRLESTLTTGYVWDVDTLPESIELLGSGHEKPAPGTPPGASVKQTFRFRVRKAGEYLINFSLKRKWESNPIRSYTVKVQAN